jgi:hypothetical protein
MGDSMIVPVPQFTAPSYGGRTLNQVQRCVNLYPQETPEGWNLVSMPGYSILSTVDLSYGFRGAYYSTTGKVFCVTNSTVWEINSSGTTTNRGSIISGTTPIYMADNGVDVLIVGSGTTGYYLTMVGGSVTAIVDANYPGGATHCAFHNSRFIITVANSGTFYLSDLQSASDWTPLTFATAEAKGDNLVAVFSDGSNIHLFGKQSKETWYDTGNESFPYERVSGGTIPVGCPNTAVAAYSDGTVYFMGSSISGKGSFWAANGTSIKKISTPYIETIAKDFGSNASFAICYKVDGHSFFEVTGVTANKTIVYNITNGTWFEMSGSAGVSAYHNMRFVLNAFDDSYATVGFIGGAVAYALNYGDISLGGRNNAEVAGSTTQIVRQRIFGPISSNSRLVFHRQIWIEAEIIFDVGGTTSIAPTLDWSDDGGLTYSTALTLTKAVTSSTTGQRVVFTANRLGSSRERYYRLTFTGPAAKIILKKCELDLEEGRF